MAQPTNIKEATSEVLAIVKKKLNQKNLRIQTLRRIEQEKREDLFSLRAFINEREKGPFWARQKTTRILWKLGSGKLWNRNLLKLKQKYLKLAREVKHSNKLLSIEKKSLQQIEAIVQKLDKISEHRLADEPFNRTTAAAAGQIISRLTKFQVITLQGVNQAVSRLQALSERLKHQKKTSNATNGIRKQREIDFLPYRSRHHDRIYLPIPYSLSYFAGKIGAKMDLDIKNAGRTYIPPHTDLSPFDAYLPLAFRKKPTHFAFWPIEPRNTKSLNLHNIFDKNTWDHIRITNYAKTGRRCIVCGELSGELIDQTRMSNPNYRRDAVDCHEVWEWVQPYKDIPIGVQSLKRLMILCFKCHMAFHDNQIIERTRHNKAEIQNIIGDLFKHREFMSRMYVRDIAREMSQRRTIVENMNHIDDWVLDLSRLSNQDYIQQMVPTFNHNNRIHFPAERIAGLTFKMPSGEWVTKKSTREVYNTILRERQQRVSAGMKL